MMLRLVLLLFALLSLPDLAGATRYWVATTGSDANSCASVSGDTDPGVYRLTPLNGAACLTNPGDRLTIKAGTYTGTGARFYETTISVANGTAGNPTIIEGEGEVGCALASTCATKLRLSGAPATNLEDASYITIRGLEIDNTNVYAGIQDSCFRLGGTGDHIVFLDVELHHCANHGLFQSALYSTLSLYRVNFHDAGLNAPGDAHGCYLQGDDNYVSGSWFHHNTVSGSSSVGCQFYNSGGLSNGSADRPTVIGSRFNNNGIGAAFDGVDVLAYNNLVYDNSTDGFAIGYEEVVTGARFFNNTFARNGGRGLRIGAFNTANGTRAINNHAVENSTNIAVESGSTGVVQTTNRTTGTLSDCTPSSLNFTQKVGSSCIDAGTDLGAHGVLADFFNVRRPQGDGYDIGASEFVVAKGFTIPNVANAFHASQAQVDTGDLAIVAAGQSGIGVIYGCAVTAQGSPNMTLALSAGTVRIGFATASVSANTLTITTADSTNPRFDLVVADLSGIVSVVAGTPAASPVYPTFPADSVAVLAAVYVPASDTAIASNQITDKRVLLPLIDTAEIDFGAAGSWTAKTTVTAPSVTVASRILVTQSGLAATSRQADENEMDALVCSATPASGAYTLQCTNPRSLTHGKFKVHVEVY